MTYTISSESVVPQNKNGSNSRDENCSYIDWLIYAHRLEVLLDFFHSYGNVTIAGEGL
jgi:hypothetical protein